MKQRGGDIHLILLVLGTVLLTAALVAALMACSRMLFTTRQPYLWSIALTVGLGCCLILGMRWVHDRLKKSVDDAGKAAAAKTYLLLKVIKLFIFMGTAATYLIIVNSGAREFIQTAAVIYLIFLMWDTCGLLILEKKNEKR